jgi:hypothetical protein
MGAWISARSCAVYISIGYSPEALALSVER